MLKFHAAFFISLLLGSAQTTLAETLGSHEEMSAEATGETSTELPPCPGYDPTDDPFSFNARFSVGPNKGQCIDMNFRRPTVTLSPEEIKKYLPDLKLQPSDRVVANVTDDKRNYYAIIPSDAVENIVIQKELFDPGSAAGAMLNKATGFSAHMQSRFVLKKNKEMTLIPQSAKERAKDPTPRKIKQFVVSAEALSRADGDSFDIVKGLKNSFGIGTRVVTLEAKKIDMIDKQKHKVMQFSVKPVVNTQLNPRDTADSVRQKYLLSALSQSAEESKQFFANRPVMYDTLQNSCFTRGLLFYDKVNQYNSKAQAMSEALKRNPMVLRSYLFTRGMMNVNTNPSTWDLDFADELKQKGSGFEF